MLLLSGGSGGLLCHVVGSHFGSRGGELNFVEREDVVVIERRGIPAKVIGSSAFTMMWHFLSLSVPPPHLTPCSECTPQFFASNTLILEYTN